METVKLIDKSNNAVIEVNKSIAGDYIGTNRFELYTEKKSESKSEEEKNDSKKSFKNKK